MPRPATCLEAALDELCVRYGYCLDAGEVAALQADHPETAEQFVDAVLVAEGLDPALQEKRSRRELVDVVREWLFDEGEGRGSKSGLPRFHPEYDPATYDPTNFYWPPPETFQRFLERILAEIPEFKAVVDVQIRLDLGEIYSAAIFDALSTAAMQVQKRILAKRGSKRDEAIVETWLDLAEAAMDDPYVADSFLQTAGDDFLWDASGPSLHSRLRPRFRAELHRRYPEMITEREA